MAFNEKYITRISAVILISVLVIAAFFLLRPILLSIVAGLLLAYVLNPIYKKVRAPIKNKTIAALLVCLIVIIVIFLPLWFLVPIIIKQVFDMFKFIQGMDVGNMLATLFPGAPPQFLAEANAIMSNFVGDVTTTTLTKLVAFLFDAPNILLQLSVVVFVFFFALRDQEKLINYVSDLSPLKKSQEQLLVREFKEITSSIIYGFIIIGLVQGIITGIGLFVFGVPRALLLTIFAIFFSVFPLIGPWLIWVPAALFLLVKGNTGVALVFILYNVIIVSSIDNILRPYIVSKRSSISPVIALVGMIGGLIVFGLLGLILGPLILAYLIIFLTAYKNKQLSSMFHDDAK